MPTPKAQAKPIKTDTWDTTHCPQCGGRAIADHGRTTFTTPHGTFCQYECLRLFEEKLYQRCGACGGRGRVERSEFDLAPMAAGKTRP